MRAVLNEITTTVQYLVHYTIPLVVIVQMPSVWNENTTIVYTNTPYR
jgi:hypothetical protein